VSNLDAFLMTIRKCEGTDGPNGPRMMFGGRLFDSFDDHPRIRFPYTDKNGKTYTTSAAGAFQFEIATWDRIARKLGLDSFSLENQEAAAAELIAEQGAMADVKDGRLQDAIDKCSSQWASLPASTVAQPKRTYVFATEAYADAGGTFA
jgi:muramidase (phage lysozyme)